MSKRSSKSGDSPTPKSQKFAGSSSSESSSKQLNCSLSFLDDHSGGGSSQPPDQIDFRFDTGSSPTSSNYGFPVNPDSDTLSNQSEASSFFHNSQPNSQPPSQIISNPSSSQDRPLDIHQSNSSPATKIFPPDLETGEETDLLLLADITKSGSESSSEIVFDHLPDNPDGFHFEVQPDSDFADILAENIACKGITQLAETVLNNDDLKKEILRILLLQSHQSLKTSLKNSQLCADKKDRNYLLTLTPKSLCEEFRMNASPSFLLLVQGLLGISDPEAIFENQFLQNNVCLLYSTLSKVVNRKASGYALLMTSAARDGGLREDSIKLFPSLVHPRTSQKYDKEVLSKGWDQPLAAALQSEKEHFRNLHEAIKKKSELILESASEAEIDLVGEEIDQLWDTTPPQVQKVWDNLNLRTKHRFERESDEYSKNNFDWMASMWIKDRIDVNHMDSGKPVKDAADLKIEDFVPTEMEKDYVFQSLVCYFSNRLVHRYPEVFKSLKSSMKPNKPHQFQSEMDSKSEEYTGELFTKSESKTEDLIEMMTVVQNKYVHTFKDQDGTVKCYEKKILSGDNKTEKNQTFGILRLLCD